ncbi:MAG: diguanylate cyclase [Oscillospiraceae bacterium]|nr:diguanylate cyclase [Oscillospiraceae bacterium]
MDTLTVKEPDPTLDSAILDSLNMAVYYVDSDLKIQRWNKATQELTGYEIKDLPGKCCRGNLLCSIDKDSEPLCYSGKCRMEATIKDGVPREGVAFVRNRSGDRVAVKAQTKPVYSGENIIGALAVLNKSEDSVETKNELVDSLTKIALTDKLTGLYNRRYFEGELIVRLSEIRADKTQYGILFLDIDNFSNFNNTYGHDTGDAVLAEMSNAIVRNIRKTDVFCRWGGEEFVGMFEVDSFHGLITLGNKILKSVRDVRVPHNGEELSITASIGITDARAGDTVEGVIRRADKFMYDSKTAGKNRYTIG